MKVITPPLIEPVSVAEVKEQIGFQPTDTAVDSLITRRIVEARQWAEIYTDRAFITQTREEYWDRFCGRHKLPSALTVISVKYVDVSGVEQTLDTSNYVLNRFKVVPFVRVAADIIWPDTRREESAVRIQYTAGYGPLSTDVPPLIKEAIILLVGHWQNFQRNNENGGGISRTPYAVRDMLDTFKAELT